MMTPTLGIDAQWKKISVVEKVVSGAVSGMKSLMLPKKDGWLVTRGVRAGQRGSRGGGRMRTTTDELLHFLHKHTQLSGPERDHSQNTLLLHPPSPGYHWHHFSLAHIHMVLGGEAACCPCGLWRIITQHYALKSNSQLPPFLNGWFSLMLYEKDKRRNKAKSGIILNWWQASERWWQSFKVKRSNIEYLYIQCLQKHESMKPEAWVLCLQPW